MWSSRLYAGGDERWCKGKQDGGVNRVGGEKEVEERERRKGDKEGER